VLTCPYEDREDRERDKNELKSHTLVVTKASPGMASSKKPLSPAEARVQLAELEAEKETFLAEAKKKGMYMWKSSNGKMNVDYPDTVMGRTLRNRWEVLKFKMGKCHKVLKAAGEEWRPSA
jgi:hypothetical protein